MITKSQWHTFCESINWAKTGHYHWDVKVKYRNEEIDFIADDVIYCKPNGYFRTVFKHPESIPENRRLHELYGNVEVTGTMHLKPSRKF